MAYGTSGYDDVDPSKVDDLPKIYEEHIKNGQKINITDNFMVLEHELGWATVHPILLKYGWIYKGD